MTAARRLAAIVAVDVLGYSRLMGEDEAATSKPEVRPTSRAVTCTADFIANHPSPSEIVSLPTSAFRAPDWKSSRLRAFRPVPENGSGRLGDGL